MVSHNSKEQTFEERFANLRGQIDELTQWFASKGLVQIEQKNLMQAGIASTKSSQEVLDTMISFMNGDLNGGYQPPAIGMLSDNPQQSSLKQAGIQKKVSDIEMMSDFLAFSGF